MTTSSLLPVGTRENCPLPGVGKYWAYAHGGWHRVQVTELPKNGGTGALQYAPIARQKYHPSYGLQSAQVFFGPLTSWGSKPPRASKKKLKELGAYV